MKVSANLATGVESLHDDEVDSQPGEHEAGHELEVDHPKSELNASILPQYPMPERDKSRYVYSVNAQHRNSQLGEQVRSEWLENWYFLFLLPKLLDGSRGEVLLGDVVVVFHVLVVGLVRRVRLEARFRVPPTLWNENTGCLTVSVSTLIAYFSAIVEYHEASF